jgi:hypothetical protein
LYLFVYQNNYGENMNRYPRRIIAITIIIALLAIAIVGGFFRVNAASATVKSYIDDTSSYQFDAAFSLICPNKRADIQQNFDAGKVALSALQLTGMTLNTSKLTYTVNNWGLMTATVSVSGDFSATIGGFTQSTSLSLTGITLAPSGLGWCLSTLPSPLKVS